MAAISGKYLGNLCSEFTHNPSGAKITVDGNGNEVTDIMQKGNWYTITFTKETLTTYCGWTTDDLILKELNGTTSFFGFSNNCVKLTDEGSPVTFYFDEISYSVA